MDVPLTSRQVRIVQRLLERPEPVSTAALATELRLSPRMVRSDLTAVDRFLRGHAISLLRKRGVGVWLEGSSDSIESVRTAVAGIDARAALRVTTPGDRLWLTVFELLSAAPNVLTVEHLARRLEVSITSARRDLGRAEKWLADRGLFLARRPGVGVRIVASETELRRSLVKLLLESIPSALEAEPGGGDEWWNKVDISVGIREFAHELPLGACGSIVAGDESLRIHAASGHSWLAADLAVTVFRVRAGHPLRLEPGILRSLRDHPVWETAEAIAAEVEARCGVALDEAEIGGITEHLLGLVELSEPTIEDPEASVDPLVDEAVAYAARRLHPALADDAELAKNLGHHVDRLRVRLKYGLPVHNPLLREVSTRYPKVHGVALHIAAMIGKHLGVPVSPDEAGFVTMYLSGALERLRLKPRPRAVVVCPAGSATAWILVSRIQAEFPELDLVEVLPAGSMGSDSAPDIDMVISTVEIPDLEPEIPVLVVNALLPPDDVRRLARLM